MNTSLINIQGLTVTITTIESITGITTIVTEITLTDKITIIMEYVCSNGEDPIMLNCVLILKINHNSRQDGTTN